MSFTIGVTGGSGSGKTYFINELASHFLEQEMCFISMDHYYKPREVQPIDKKGHKNFDLPDSIDREAFKADIEKLKKGEVVSKSEYTFNNPNVTPKTLTFTPAPILVIEGLFVQYYNEVNEELDLKIFIDAKDDIRLGRRIKRDKEERGYDLSDVLYRYEYHTMPVYEQFISPLQQGADLIILNNDNFKVAVEVLAGFLKQKLSGIAN